MARCGGCTLRERRRGGHRCDPRWRRLRLLSTAGNTYNRDYHGKNARGNDSAMLNVFLDQHGVLDADYEAALAAGTPQRVLRPAREPIPWPGRYLVIVDSQVAERPAWSPPPGGAVATVKARR